MAINKIQLVSGEQLLNVIKRIADEMYRDTEAWAAGHHYIEKVKGPDIVAMKLTEVLGPEEVEILKEFKAVLTDYIALYNGNPVTPVYNMRDIINKIRRPMPI